MDQWILPTSVPEEVLLISSQPLLFFLQLKRVLPNSVTRCWIKNVSKVALIYTSVFTLIQQFQKSPKSKIFVGFWGTNLLPRTTKNRPIWSHNYQILPNRLKYFSLPRLPSEDEMSPLCRCCKTFLVKPHSPPDGFYWDHQCSWTLTSANSMRVYIMQTDDCYRKWQGLRQGLNQLCQRYLEWMGEQLGANISFLVSGFAWRKTCKMLFVEEILISPNLSTEK